MSALHRQREFTTILKNLGHWAIRALLLIGAYFFLASFLFGQKAGDEIKVLETFFKITHEDDDIVMEPLLCPRFKLVLMHGDGKQADTIVKCGVWKRVEQVDEKASVVMFVTVLKCPNGNVYGLSEVDFQSQNPND